MLDKDTAATDDCAMLRIPGACRRAWFLMSLLMCGCSDSQPLAAGDVSCPVGPVIFVHGLGQGPGIFDDLIASLERRGMSRDCLHAIDYSDGDLPIQKAAEEELAPFIDRVLAGLGERSSGPDAARPAMKVNLVGHSMGALSSRWYAARVRPDRVRTWISTSGANHGTDWECPRPDGTGHGDMCPGFARNARESAVQLELNGTPKPDVDETPYGLGSDSPGVQTTSPDAERSILYLTIHVTGDEYIVPSRSLLIDGAGGTTLELARGSPFREKPAGNFRFMEPSSHDGVLHSEAVADFIHRAITAVRPEPVGTVSQPSGEPPH